MQNVHLKSEQHTVCAMQNHLNQRINKASLLQVGEARALER